MIERKHEKVRAAVVVDAELLGKIHTKLAQWFDESTIRYEFETSDGVTHSPDALEDVTAYANPPSKRLTMVKIKAGRDQETAVVDFDVGAWDSITSGLPEVKVCTASANLQGRLENLRDLIHGSPGSFYPICRVAYFALCAYIPLGIAGGWGCFSLALSALINRSRPSVSVPFLHWSILFGLVFLVEMFGAHAATRSLAAIQFEIGAGKQRSRKRDALAYAFAGAVLGVLLGILFQLIGFPSR